MLVSCILPTHDRPRFVAEAIACFQAQTLVDTELVVIDDGSTAIEHLLPKKDDRIVYLRREGWRNFCVQRNEGLAVSRGKYIAVWDDDDLYHPDRLAVQVAALEDAGAGLCLLGSSIVTQEDPPLRWIYTPRTSWPLDNSAVFIRTAGFDFHLDDKPTSALRALRNAFEHSVVIVRERPELLITRRHDNNFSNRFCGGGPEWVKISAVKE